QQAFVTQSIEGGGWGGRPTGDGESASVSVCQGDVRNAPIEKMELRWPILVRGRELRTDSGGPGQYRGGLGLEIEVEGLIEGRRWLGHSVAPRARSCPAGRPRGLREHRVRGSGLRRDHRFSDT